MLADNYVIQVTGRLNNLNIPNEHCFFKLKLRANENSNLSKSVSNRKPNIPIRRYLFIDSFMNTNQFLYHSKLLKYA